jgi:hypothetical protein
VLFGHRFRKCLDIGKARQIGHVAFNASFTLQRRERLFHILQF